MVPYRGLSLYFPVNHWASFHMHIGHLFVFFQKDLFNSFAYVLLGYLSSHYLIVRFLYIFWIEKYFVRDTHNEYFCLVCGLQFHFLIVFFWRTEVSNFDKVLLINQLLLLFTLFCVLSNFCLSLGHKFFLMFSPKSFYVWYDAGVIALFFLLCWYSSLLASFSHWIIMAFQ